MGTCLARLRPDSLETAVADRSPLHDDAHPSPARRSGAWPGRALLQAARAMASPGPWRRPRATAGRPASRSQPARASWNWLTVATVAVALASAWVSADARPLETRVVASGFKQPVFAAAAPGVDSADRRRERAGLLPLARPQSGVGALKDAFPGSRAIPGVVDADAAPR